VSFLEFEYLGQLGPASRGMLTKFGFPQNRDLFIAILNGFCISVAETVHAHLQIALQDF